MMHLNLILPMQINKNRILFSFHFIFLVLIYSYAQDRSNEVGKFSNIAESYIPDNYINDSLGIIPDVPIFNKQERKIILRAFSINTKESERYVFLILLKVYKAQLKCCNMSYNLADKGYSKKHNLIVYLYIKITHVCNLKSEMECSYISSALPFTYAKTNSYLLSYSPIKKEIDEIEMIYKTPSSP